MLVFGLGRQLILFIGMKIDVVYVTKIEHLYSLNLSIQNIISKFDVSKIYIVTSKANFVFFKFDFNIPVILLDEDDILPIKFSEIKKLGLPYFPKRAGWYFQQLLKLGVSYINNLSENYVVLDADTIFLKKIDFISSEGKFVFLKSSEYHNDYFVNYFNLLNELPNREFSFISQYMVFNKIIVKELIDKIDSNIVNGDNWCLKIMSNLLGNGPSLFSEYETYGHYIKNHYASSCEFVSLPWLREGVDKVGKFFPTIEEIKLIPDEYYLVSFELRERRFFHKGFKYLFCFFFPFYFYLKFYFKRFSLIGL